MSDQDFTPIQPQQPDFTQTQPTPMPSDQADAFQGEFQMPDAPIAQPGMPQQTPYMQPPTPPAPGITSAGNNGNSLAVGALICGILAIVLSFTIALGIILGIVAIVLAILAKHKAADGKATAGLVCGIIGIVFAILTTVLLFAGIAIMDSAFDSDVAKPAADSTQITPDAEVSDTLEGTYALSSIEVDEETNGEYFNSDDLEILDYLNLESVQMSMFDDGTFYISIFGTVTPGTWEIVDEGVIRLHDGSEMISTDGNDRMNYTVADGKLVLEQEGVTVTFDKLSDTPSKFSENPEELKDTETDAK